MEPIETIYEMIHCKSLLIDFKFLKLKQAIPPKWIEGSNRNQICTTPIAEDYFEIRGDTVKLNSTKTKEFYSFFLKNRKTESLILYYWQHKLKLSLDFRWKNVLQYKLKDIKQNKIRQFNFKLLHNILPFKINLCRWKLATDTACMFCDAEETFNHIMLHCVHVSKFWKKLCDLLYMMFKLKILVDEKTLLIGHQIHDKKFMLMNLVIVYAQYAIYKAYILYKMQGKPFHVLSIWLEFKNELLSYVNWRFKYNAKIIVLFQRNLF